MQENELQRRRKVEFPFHFLPEKRMVHVVAKLRDEPGALAGVLNLLGSRVNLLGVTSYSVDGGAAVFSGFAEVLFESDNAQSIRALVAGSSDVSDCKVWESVDGLLVDMYHTGVQSGTGEPYIMMPRAGLAKTFDEIVRTFGSGGETILFLQGKGFAESRFEAYRGMLGPDPARRIEESSHIYEALGYGSSTISVEDSGAAIRLMQHDCFECTGQVRRGHSCSFTRGLAAGSFGALFGKDMDCAETKCRLRGDSECEFLVTEDKRLVGGDFPVPR